MVLDFRWYHYSRYRYSVDFYPLMPRDGGVVMSAPFAAAASTLMKKRLKLSAVPGPRHWGACHLLRAQAASRSRKSSPPQPRRRGRRRRRSTRVHHGGHHSICAPSSIWIFVERCLVRNFFACDFQSKQDHCYHYKETKNGISDL